eukprot:1943433-Amphidinium_carterae.1
MSGARASNHHGTIYRGFLAMRVLQLTFWLCAGTVLCPGCSVELSGKCLLAGVAHARVCHPTACPEPSAHERFA